MTVKVLLVLLILSNAALFAVNLAEWQSLPISALAGIGVSAGIAGLYEVRI